MTTLDMPAGQPEQKNISIPRAGTLDIVLGRIDLLAILTTLLGLCVLAVAAVVLVTIEMAKLIVTLWADSFDRWLLIVLAVALAWVVYRGKKLCVV
jgi:hypothetical protein